MSKYSEQFRRDAVALYENNEDLSLNAASAELGINRDSLHSWGKKYGTGKRARIKVVHDQVQAANDPETDPPVIQKKTQSCAKNATPCVRLRNILLKEARW
ncbi:hypothetical protein CIP107582_02281 [Corynebacterium diphtheriae]|nr:hypothetical protein CIP107582_02281 [Corynebacterium diphtheriae]